MTRRWVPGKEPTKADVKDTITNAVSKFLDPGDVERIADRIVKLYRDRAAGRS